MSRIAIRTASAANIATLANIHTQSWRVAYRGLLPDGYLDTQAHAERLALWQARFLDGRDAPIVAAILNVDDVPAGFVCLLPAVETQHGVYLDNLHVLPGHQGLGLGKRLMAWAVDYVLQHHPGQALHLNVFDGNTAARKVYRGLGGLEVERFDDDCPGGVRLPIWRVEWPDVAALRQRLG